RAPRLPHHPQVYTGWRWFALQTMVFSADSENHIEKTVALDEKL
ncbi:unnamed protein product, partial [Urochloa humidicola]